MFLAIPAWRKPGTHYSLSKYSPGTSSCGTSCVRTSFLLAFPASSTPFTTSLSNAFPSSSNPSTLSESAPATLDNPCISPDCSPARAPCSSSATATVSTLWLFLRTCFLSAPAVLPPVVFLPPTVVFTAAFFFATFLPAVLFDFACLFLVFFLVAIRAVYHRLVIPSASGPLQSDRLGSNRGCHPHTGRIRRTAQSPQDLGV